jgi:hypothetical protein
MMAMRLEHDITARNNSRNIKIKADRGSSETVGTREIKIIP